MAASTDPARPSPAARAALAAVLLHCRQQAGEGNWVDFVRLMARETGLLVPAAQFEELSRGHYTRIKPAPILALHAWGRFSFPNGDPVDAGTLAEVALGCRDSDGEPIPSAARTNP